MARSDCAEMRRFARGIMQDKAVQAALEEPPPSNGPVEGQVNRLKLSKPRLKLINLEPAPERSQTLRGSSSNPPGAWPVLPPRIARAPG